MNKKCFLLGFVAIFCFGLICGDLRMSYGQEANTGEFTLEEIKVTAEKREANLQDISLSLTSVPGEDINQIGAFNADEVLKNVPNVVVQRAARGYVVAIRGLGSDLPPGQGDSSVSTNFDGVYNYAAESGTLGYYDLERVEVLRGPQGTLYGRNATAGVVNVISKNPGDEVEGYATVEAGNYSMLRLEGAVNVPLNDNFSTRMTFVSINRDGFLSNGDDDAVGSSARVKLRYNPGDNLNVVFSTEYTKLGGHGPGSSKEEFIAAYDVENNQQNYKSYKYNANVEFTAGPGVFTFIPSYAFQDGTVIDWDGRANEFSKSWDPMDTVTKSAELRYASEGDAKIKWIGGLYYYDNVVGILGNNNPTKKTDYRTSYAAFGQVIMPFTDTLRAILGARVGIDDRSYHNISCPVSSMEEKWTTFDWKVGLENDFAKDVMGYLTVATGHRPGGFNSIALAGALAGTNFGPETLISGEIGIKSRFLDNRVQVNADVFYYDYKDYQVADFYTPEGQFIPILVLYNASAVKNKGGEVETQMLLSDYTIGKISVSYLDSSYQDDFWLHSPGGMSNLKGYPLPHAPQWTVKFELEQTISLGNGYLVPRLSARWTDEMYTNVFPSDNNLVDGYTVYDFSMLFTPDQGNWTLNMYVKNVVDLVYRMTTSNQYPKGGQMGSPRTFGAVFTAKF